MTTYNNVVTLKIPETIKDIANSIAKAFDPDTGGEYTFSCEAVDGYITVSFPCVESFALALPIFKESPELLYESVIRDYEVRWPELIQPTIEECQLFCESVEFL